MKSIIKNLNFIIFLISFTLFFSLHSYTQLSTSLLSILPNGHSKEMMQNYNKTQNSKILLVSVKGFDAKALKKMKIIEKQLKALPMLSTQSLKSNVLLEKHIEAYKFSIYPVNQEKLATLDVKKELDILYYNMITSFFLLPIDKQDPFNLLTYPEKKSLKLKDGYLTLDGYGYLGYFKLTSDNLEKHQKLYDQIHAIVKNDRDVKVFSPIFYYVENSNAIRSDVNKIIWIALSVLLLLYLLILRDASLLVNTLITLGTSTLLAVIFITQLYGEVSIFVFVFGVSISSIAVDYMFHHYVHGYYVDKKVWNKEVFFGFLTTISVFFIFSFSSFLLIKQISIFSILSLLISYLHFAYLYPLMRFKSFKSHIPFLYKNIQVINSKILLLISIVIIVLSSLWIEFDVNLRNLDFNNKSLKQTETFFSKALEKDKSIAFAISANTVDELIDHAQELQLEVSSVEIPLSRLASKTSLEDNHTLLASLGGIRHTLPVEAKKIGFKDGYFDDAYKINKKSISFTIQEVKALGIEILQINDSYISYGRVGEVGYTKVLAYDFTESLNLKERFEETMKNAIDTLVKLGFIALLMIILVIFFISKKSMGYSLLFLFFPLTVLSIYTYFTAVNILHIFMMFIILAIGVDYAIYLSNKNDLLTKEAISYSLISTFAGFGVLIFSQINALYSIGIVATIGIVSVFILLIFIKGTENES